MFPTVCRTARLVIRQLASDDVAAVHAVTNHRAITDAIPFIDYPFTELAAAELVGRNASDVERFYGIHRASAPALIGVLGAHLRGDDGLEIGYWIGPDFQRKGFATEAATALAAYLATSFPKRAVIAECRAENESSWQVLVKSGFKDSGRKGTRPGRRRLVFQR